ncbi:ATP-binding protein [Fredinandcohnia sp. QZ13]|uniref:ATP-binding protein n=1 Tax=Fredinandcohnia sp. QZ13 TaxID=3073144 RepID=UPI00285312EA|nr:ATP-binding protein [Fredinandcohnia sp. QZ13]MDR4890106.1 ATP-binding protein [Fredinandcohnia sp. QZ13]
MVPNDTENEGQRRDTHLRQLASVGQVAAGIAHEVRNPLTAVKGFLQLLQQEEEHEYLDIAQSELNNALHTLNNLLQVSKPDLEDEDAQVIHLAAELESILNLFLDKLYEIELESDFQNTDATIVGKKNQFKKAFFNLIKNAIESIEGNGKIKITHRANDKDVFVTIEDSGVGIPKEKMNLLGTPFFSTKDAGTGMGLAQVFSVVYQHGGDISVDSELNAGTTFTIRLPKQLKPIDRGVRKLNLIYKDSIKEFFLENKVYFEEKLLEEAINVKDKIEDIHTVGNINLLDNAHKLVLYVVEEREHELITFAKREGIAWAKNSLTLAFKLEWVQSIRRTLWDFLYNYDLLLNNESSRDEFFALEKKMNILLDHFLTHFFISYSKFKDGLLESQRQLVENLSVPIIPINQDTYIIPLIGGIDQRRLLTIEDKILFTIENEHIRTLIMDLSGVAFMEDEVIYRFRKLIEGIKMMGCQTVLTGIRAEIVKKMIALGISFADIAESKGTLQLALKDYLFVEDVVE